MRPERGALPGHPPGGLLCALGSVQRALEDVDWPLIMNNRDTACKASSLHYRIRAHACIAIVGRAF